MIMYFLDQFWIVCSGPIWRCMLWSRIVIAGVGAFRERKLLLLMLRGGVLECAGVFWNVVELSGGRAHSPSRLSADFATALTPPPTSPPRLSSRVIVQHCYVYCYHLPHEFILFKYA